MMDVYDWLECFGSLHAAYQDVEDFHVACGLPCPAKPTLPEDFNAVLKLREKLIDEEVEETFEALYNLRTEPALYIESNMAEVADGIADTIYVLLGTAATLGLPMAEIWRRVHESNMAKVKDGVRKREDGKILKPEGWQPPDVLGAIREAMK